MADTIASVASAITGNNSTTSSTTTNKASIAQNFDTFLQLLTTQLKNQNPLEPLDTNQFTQQLVQFAQVEQQMSMNQQLTTLISLQKATQTQNAMSFLGATATVDGATATLKDNNPATWTFSADKPASATINITNSAGVLVYTGNFSLNAGIQNFQWDGRGNNGTKYPDGDYKMSITAKDASGNTVAVSTQVQGTVDSVDLTADPPVLVIGGQKYGLDKVRQVVRPGA
jgi:flagellar basal-body rod modification protein FlgD